MIYDTPNESVAFKMCFCKWLNEYKNDCVLKLKSQWSKQNQKVKF
jgi:hypothetical protein